jgi:hypothetical protein
VFAFAIAIARRCLRCVCRSFLHNVLRLSHRPVGSRFWLSSENACISSKFGRESGHVISINFFLSLLDSTRTVYLLAITRAVLRKWRRIRDDLLPSVLFVWRNFSKRLIIFRKVLIAAIRFAVDACPKLRRGTRSNARFAGRRWMCL